jgi:hypothetical protein
VSSGIAVQKAATDQQTQQDAHNQAMNMGAEKHALDVTSAALGMEQGQQAHEAGQEQQAESHDQALEQAESAAKQKLEGE